MAIWWRLAGCASLLAWAAPALPAQDSVTVAAGEQYRAGGLHRLVLGTGYRAAWTAPISVPVLDLGSFGGGLTATEEGGGKATESLRFRGADGLEYVFRSVDKRARRALPEDLQGSVVERIAQDLTSAKHPAAGLAVPPIMDALGLLHVSPALYVMPDDPRLGGFREKWRGRLGQVELRLENDLAEVMFPGADDMESTDDFLDEMEEHPRNRVDAHAYLKARLADLWIGDWDRHPDQWRWVRFDDRGVRTWHPVPRDRDNAFVRYEGLIMGLARTQRPNLVRFSPRIGPIYPMHYHSSETDRELLAFVPRAEWDSVALWVRSRLTDEVIDRALLRLPPEYRRLHAPTLREALRARRDQIPGAAAALYELVAREAEVHGTDEAEDAQVVRRPDGSVEVVIRPREGDGERLARRRTFVPAETREVRVYLHGGDDMLRVDGVGPLAIALRVVGGGGDDHLVETARGGAVARFYDHRGENSIEGGRVDTRDWESPTVTPIGGDPREPRDYGSDLSLFKPYLRWQANVGPVVGVGPARTTYGFRRVPFAGQFQLRAVYAPLAPHGYGAELAGIVHRTGSPAFLTLSLRGNRFETWRFHGFGNDTPEGNGEDFLVRHDLVGADVLYHAPLGGDWSIAVGPTASWRSPSPRAGEPANLGVPGSDTHLMGGGRLRIGWDQRDTLPVTRRGGGWTAEALGAGWTDGAPFGRIATEARVYLPLVRGGPSLALRAGAEHAFGDFPFQEAAWLGGGARLRGYAPGRFLGESAYWGSGELRQPLGTVRLLVRGRLGVIALADAGFVEVDGSSPGDAHTAFGGGLWFETLGKVGSVTYAYGDAGRLYFTLGLPF